MTNNLLGEITKCCLLYIDTNFRTVLSMLVFYWWFNMIEVLRIMIWFWNISYRILIVDYQIYHLRNRSKQWDLKRFVTILNIHKFIWYAIFCWHDFLYSDRDDVWIIRKRIVVLFRLFVCTSLTPRANK